MNKMSTPKSATLHRAQRIIEQMKRSKKKRLTVSQQKTLLKAAQLYGQPQYLERAQAIASAAGAREPIQSGTRLRTTDDIGTPQTVSSQLAAESEEGRRYVESLSGSERMRLERGGLPVARRKVPAPKEKVVGVSGEDRSYPVDTPGYRRVVMAQTLREGMTPLQRHVAFTRYRESPIQKDPAPDDYGATRIEKSKVGKVRTFVGKAKEKAGFVRGGRFSEVVAGGEYGREAFPIVYPVAKFLVVGVAVGAGVGAAASAAARMAPHVAKHVPKVYYLVKPLIKPAASAAAGFGTAVSGEQEYARLRDEAGYPVWKSVLGAVVITGAGVAGGIGGFRAVYKPVKITPVQPKKTRVKYTRDVIEAKEGADVGKPGKIQEVLKGERVGEAEGIKFKSRFTVGTTIDKASGGMYQKSIEDVVAYRIQRITTKQSRTMYKLSFISREERFGEALGTAGVGSRVSGIEKTIKVKTPRGGTFRSVGEAESYVKSLFQTVERKPGRAVASIGYRGKSRPVGRVQIYQEQDVVRTKVIGKSDVYVYTARQLRFEPRKALPKKYLGVGVQAERELSYFEDTSKFVTRYKGKVVGYQMKAERLPPSRQPGGMGGISSKEPPKTGGGKQTFHPGSGAGKPGAGMETIRPDARPGGSIGSIHIQKWPGLAASAQSTRLVVYTDQAQAVHLAPPGFARHGFSPVMVIQRAKLGAFPIASVVPASQVLVSAQVSELGQVAAVGSRLESVQVLSLKMSQVQQQVQIQEQTQAQVLSQVSASALVTAQVQQQVQVQQQEQVLEQVQSTVAPPVPRTDIFKIFRPPSPSPPFDVDDEEEDEGDGLFGVEVRRGGVFRRIGLVGSAEAAVRLGMFRVRHTAAASFRVDPVDDDGVELEEAFGGLVPADEFRESLKEPGVFIQRRQFRISTAGEKREITFKGIESRRKRGDGFKL